MEARARAASRTASSRERVRQTACVCVYACARSTQASCLGEYWILYGMACGCCPSPPSACTCAMALRRKMVLRVVGQSVSLGGGVAASEEPTSEERASEGSVERLGISLPRAAPSPTGLDARSQQGQSKRQRRWRDVDVSRSRPGWPRASGPTRPTHTAAGSCQCVSGYGVSACGRRPPPVLV